MNFNQLLAQLTPDLVAVFEQSVAIRKWPNGEPMTEEQIESVVAALIAYQAKHAPSDEPFTVNAEGELMLGKGRKYQTSSVPGVTGDILHKK